MFILLRHRHARIGEGTVMQRVILALDELTLDEALDLVSKISPRVYGVKVHNIVDQHGPSVVKQLLQAGARRVWVDAKLHDIPNTVRLRANAIMKSGADIITVHASGEIEMMIAAVEGGHPSKIFAVTVLTSLGEEQTELYGQSSKAAVLYFARLAKLAKVHGIVCSPQEVGVLSKRPELQGLEFVVPGIRSAGKDAGDQKRVGTPFTATKDGATCLVVGRQITQASDPIAALDELEQEIAEAEIALQGGV